jgi:hypothetical protein
MNSSTKKEARLFNLMKNLRDRKKKQKQKKKKKKKKKRKKKNLLSFQGPSPLVCPIFVLGVLAHNVHKRTQTFSKTCESLRICELPNGLKIF